MGGIQAPRSSCAHPPEDRDQSQYGSYSARAATLSQAATNRSAVAVTSDETGLPASAGPAGRRDATGLHERMIRCEANIPGTPAA